jgi:CheY-like chemotaxis protein
LVLGLVFVFLGLVFVFLEPEFPALARGDFATRRGERLVGLAFKIPSPAFRDRNLAFEVPKLEEAVRAVLFPVRTLHERVLSLRERDRELGPRLTPPLPVSVTMSEDSHCILVAEDDSATAKQLASDVASLGMRARMVSTLEEVDKAIAEGRFCCVLLDKQLPSEQGAAPYAATGDTALKKLRAYDPRRNELNHHVLGIVIVTGVSQSDTFINDNYRRGATAFVAKPAEADRIAAEALGALEGAGRLSAQLGGRMRKPAGCGDANGGNSSVAHFDGTSFTTYEVGAEIGFLSLWGYDATHVWIGDDSGRIFRFVP